MWVFDCADTPRTGGLDRNLGGGAWTGLGQGLDRGLDGVWMACGFSDKVLWSLCVACFWKTRPYMAVTKVSFKR